MSIFIKKPSNLTSIYRQKFYREKGKTLCLSFIFILIYLKITSENLHVDKKSSDFQRARRISEQESLFSYPFGKSYASYNNSDFRPNFNIPPLNKIDNYTREICKDDMNCIYDLQTTGNTDIAVSTMEAMDEFVAVEKVLSKNYFFDVFARLYFILQRCSNSEKL
ncbi:hypothetical protein KUTeg_022717 [Tegillarca granosa]|uniref:Mucin-4-like C8-3 domain-containing protein n=1 Tax=Tegillarca granosa TaxID=220873 RepID=A0ABQ9E059_TEGGR|nr:hypothetical protein KUTeg_022717 [Tegillarca granosa]